MPDTNPEKIEWIPINLIDHPSFDVRFLRSEAFANRLVEDIEREDKPIPLILRLKSDNRYECLEGETRLVGYRRRGYEKVPAIVYRNVTDEDAIILSIKYNTNRRNLPPASLAKAFLELRRKGLKQRDIVARFNGQYSKSYISKLCKIARKLNEEDMLRLERGELTVEQCYSYVSDRPYSPHSDIDAYSRFSKLKCESCGEKFDRFNLYRVCYECLDSLRKARKSVAKRRQKRLDDSQSVL